MASKNELCSGEILSEVSGPINARVYISCDKNPQQDAISSATGFTTATAVRHGQEAGEYFVQRCQAMPDECLLRKICQGERRGIYDWRPIDKDKHPRLNF